MAKVSQLTPASTLNLTDLLLLTQAGESIKIDIETMLLNLPSRLIVKETAESVATGVIATNILSTLIQSKTAPAAYTLASGLHGMEKEIVCSAAEATTPTAVVTVTNGAGFTTITFSAVGQSAKLKNVSGNWYIIGSNGVVIA